ncbi:MAG: sigma factor-like helix-turn-helix DNA-binding protein, partial [Prochloraceae cyanobacterium]
DLVNHFMSKDIEMAFSSVLTSREAEVMRLRYGLDDGNPKTLQQIGDRFKCTRERVRQLESKALKKLRNPNAIQRLKGYLS